MYENFIMLEKGKRDRIINAAMHEFSVMGFKKTSTNEIVKRAGISKGALFHYFPTKTDLFKFLYNYSTDFVFEEIMANVNDLPPDIFERWLHISRLKFGVMARYPDMMEFLVKMFKDDAPEMSGFIRDEFQRVSKEFLAALYEGLDLSRFKDDVDVNRALKIIWWVLEGYALEKQREMDVSDIIDMNGIFDGLINEMDGYLTVLKKSFYKEQFQ